LTDEHFYGEEIINDILNEDIHDDDYVRRRVIESWEFVLKRSQILQLTIWMAKNYLFKNVDESNKIEQRGKHDRVMYMPDRANVREILADNVRHRREKMLVIDTLFNPAYETQT